MLDVAAHGVANLSRVRRKPVLRHRLGLARRVVVPLLDLRTRHRRAARAIPPTGSLTRGYARRMVEYGRGMKKLDDERRARLLSDLQSFFLDELDEELSAFRAEQILDFVLSSAGPEIYNLSLLHI